MAAQTLVTARVMAQRLSKSLGRPITDKAVRSWVRDNLTTHDKTKHPEYQSHAYSADEQRRIEAGFKARTVRATIQRASKGASKPKSKPATRKPASKPAAPASES